MYIVPEYLADVFYLSSSERNKKPNKLRVITEGGAIRQRTPGTVQRKRRNQIQKKRRKIEKKQENKNSKQS